MILDRLAASDGLRERQRCVLALGGIGDKTSVPMLVRLLQQDGDEGVSLNCASILGKLGDPDVLAPLIAALREDSDPKVREIAARA